MAGGLANNKLYFIRHLCLIVTCCLFGLGLFYPTAEAEDYLILLDNSGSMLETDPNNLRFEGLRIFGNFLKDTDKVKVVTLAGEVITDQVSFNLKQYLADLNRYQIRYSEYTDLYTQLSLINDNRIVILISDGKMEPRPSSGRNLDEESKYKQKMLVEQVLPRLKSSSIHVNTISFSENADQSLLKSIASSTGGINWYSPDDKALNRFFSEVVVNVSKPEQLPIRKEGVIIDNAVEEATFYLERQSGQVQITTPDNRLIVGEEEGVRWYAGKGFDVITIINPDPGQWGVSGVGFATVLTKLKLNIDWPSDVRIGDKVKFKARLFELNKPISLADISGVLKVGFQFESQDKISLPQIRGVMHDNGEDPDEEEGDGEFVGEVSFDEPGNYKLRVITKSPTFEREKSQIFEVKEPWLKLEKSEDEIIIHLHEDAAIYKEVAVKVQFASEDNSAVVEANKIKPMQYSVKISEAISLNGQYGVSANLEIRKRDKIIVEAKSKTLDLHIDTLGDGPVFEKIIKVKEEEHEENEEHGENYLLVSVLMLLVSGGVVGGFWLKVSKMTFTKIAVEIESMPESFIDFSESLQILCSSAQENPDEGEELADQEEDDNIPSGVTELFMKDGEVSESEDAFRDKDKEEESPEGEELREKS